MAAYFPVSPALNWKDIHAKQDYFLKKKNKEKEKRIICVWFLTREECVSWRLRRFWVRNSENQKVVDLTPLTAKRTSSKKFRDIIFPPEQRKDLGIWHNHLINMIWA